MLLITENFENTVHTIQEDASGKKRLYIEGIFAQAEVENGNRRIYPKEILSREINEYNEKYVKTRRALGELNHPRSPNVNPERASHRIISLNENGNDYLGKALVLDTPMGNIVRGLVEGGTSIGVSTRGLGTLTEMRGGLSRVNDDFSFKCVDVVADPSAPSAFVNGLMEGVEWIYQDGILKQQTLDMIEQESKIIKSTNMKNLNEQKLKSFHKILSKIVTG